MKIHFLAPLLIFVIAFAIFQALQVILKVQHIISYHLKFVGPQLGTPQPITAGIYSTFLFFLSSLIVISFCFYGRKIAQAKQMQKTHYAFLTVLISTLLFDLAWLSLVLSPFVKLSLR